MSRYRIRFSKENGGKYYQTIVDAIDEAQAFRKAADEAKSKGIDLPDEVWTRIEKLTFTEPKND